jgi:hypothetical protein
MTAMTDADIGELLANEKEAAEELSKWREKRRLTANGAEARNSIGTFVDSPIASARPPSWLAPAAETK